MSQIVRRIVVHCSVTFAVVLSAIVGGEAQAQELEGRKYAVLVGVRQYDPNQLRNLSYPENDVTELADFLKQSGFRRVELLTQTEGAKQARSLPMAQKIREALKGILEDRSMDDLVLVAFAGHGIQFRGEKEHYFCPMDAVLTDRTTLVSLTDIYKQLGESKAGAKLLIVDACRNDPQAANSRARDEVQLNSVTRPELPNPPGGVAALFSCSAGERAFEDASLKHGIFFHHVLLGLKGEARLKNRDTVTWDGLVAYVKAEVPDTVKDLVSNTTRQIPENKGELRGEVTIISLATPARLLAPFSAAQAVAAQTAWAKYLNVQRTVTNASGGEMVLIPPGEYLRGSSDTDVAFALNADSELKMEYLKREQPQHRVRITKPFYMAKFETTQGQFQKLLERNTASFCPAGVRKGRVSGLTTAQFPIENVTWYDCIEFCNKLSEAEGKSPCYDFGNIERETDQSIKSATVRVLHGTGYRLPTEAEWEYACRAGTTTAFHFGNLLNGKQANVDGNYPFGTTTKGPYLERTSKVGDFPANNFGLFDMCGNVYEWCQDGYDESAYGEFLNNIAVDPAKDTDVPYRVLRGGSWLNASKLTRSAYRNSLTPGLRVSNGGFRVVCVCGPRT